MSVTKNKRWDSGSHYGADVLVLGVLLFLIFGVLSLIDSGNQSFAKPTEIDTSLHSLPEYTLLSLTRSLVSLSISYTFAIVYGTLAARSPRNERLMVPILDVLQSLPVLTFLGGFILFLTSLFPHSRWGVEIACILSIFTGQAWNLCFAYFESQRSMPPELREVARLNGLTGFKRFVTLDLPNGAKQLIYNGMMSMSGGWFFLTTCEAIDMGGKDYTLPGLGSYLSKTYQVGNMREFVIGLLCLMLLIIGMDFLLWRPLIAWVSKFREDPQEPAQESWFYNILSSTTLPTFFSKNVLGFLRALSPLQLAPKSVRNSLSLDKIVPTFDPRNWIARERWQKESSGFLRAMFPWFVTFLLGGGVFSLLHRLPAIGASLSKVPEDIWTNATQGLLYTGVRVLLVLGLASLWCVPVGIWIGQSPKLSRIAQPIVQNLSAFPAPVILPVIGGWMLSAQMSSEWIVLLSMTLGNQWYVLFNVIAGATKISPDLKMVGRIYGFNFYQKFTKIYLPSVLPSLITGWITCAGGAWNVSIVSEYIVLNGDRPPILANGIGRMIQQATKDGDIPRLIAATVAIVIGLVILNRTLWRSLHKLSLKFKD